MFFSQQSFGSPGLMILAGTVVAALVAGSFIRRRLRARHLNRSKLRARKLLLDVRRACVLPQTDLPLNQVPLVIRMIRRIGESAGFELRDIGASEKQLEKFLIVARDGKVPDRGYRPPVYRTAAAAWLPDQQLLTATAGLAATPSPGPIGKSIVIETIGEQMTNCYQQNFQNERWVEFDTGQPELGDEIIIEIEEPRESPGDQEVIVGRSADVEWSSGGRPDDEPDPDINQMFDRITRSDEEARARPSKGITILVDGKKFGF